MLPHAQQRSYANVSDPSEWVTCDYNDNNRMWTATPEPCGLNLWRTYIETSPPLDGLPIPYPHPQPLSLRINQLFWTATSVAQGLAI